MVKTIKQLERHFKGIANHRRLEILYLINGSEGITLDEIAYRLKCNLKTIAEHTKRLTHAGLVTKKYKGRNVCHRLSDLGKEILKFVETFRLS